MQNIEGLHPSVCTVCCKRVATSRLEWLCDSWSDLFYALIACVEFVGAPLVMLASLVFVTIPAVLTSKPRLSRRQWEELQRIKSVQDEYFTAQKAIEHLRDQDLKQMQKNGATEEDYQRVDEFNYKIDDLKCGWYRLDADRLDRARR